MLKQLYATHPGDATFVTSYAFALAQVGKGPEALAIVDKLTPEERSFPPRQPYLAFIYGVARDEAKLDRAVALAKGGSFLPEEATLFQRARTELTKKPVKKL